jgi:hypothetical protein
MATAESFTVLLLSFMLFTMTATISGAPYTVTNTAVPLEQRGLFNALWVRTNNTHTHIMSMYILVPWYRIIGLILH